MSEIEAAPPDCGGHTGQASRPEGLMARPNADSPRRGPHLHRLDPSREGQHAYAEFLTALGLACGIVACVVALAALA